MTKPEFYKIEVPLEIILETTKWTVENLRSYIRGKHFESDFENKSSMTGLLASVGVTHVVSGVLAVSLAGYVIHKSVNGKADSTDSSNDEKETKEDSDDKEKHDALTEKLLFMSAEIERLRSELSEMSEAEHTYSVPVFQEQKILNEDTDDDIPDLEVHPEQSKDYRRSNSSGSNASSTPHILGSVQTSEIRGTWKVILGQLQRVGVQCIVDLFELHPFVKDHFRSILVQFSKADPENEDALHELLENHARLVMNVVHELVTNVDNMDLLYEKLKNLGLFHLENKVPARYLDIMGPIFCNAVRPILLHNDCWSPEVEDSWMELFKILTTIMKKSYTEVISHEPLALNPTQKCVIKSTWQSIFLKHMNSVGQQLFMDLFEVEPNVLKYFEAFRDVGLKNLLQSRSFQNHGVRIMNLVKFAVENLDRPDKLQDHMLVLGRLHVKKGIDSKFLELMGPTFCHAIRPMLMSEGGWSIEIENAWLQLFKILVQMMTVAYGENEIFGEFPTKRQLTLLLQSWCEIQNELEEVGIETFRKLFESHSDIQSYFPSMKRLSSSDLEMTRKVKEHSSRIMAVVRLFIENIDDVSRVTEELENLGSAHYRRGIKSEFIDVMGPIFCNTIRPLLVKKDLWTIELEEVWLTLFKKICRSMKKGYPKEKRKTFKTP